MLSFGVGFSTGLCCFFQQGPSEPSLVKYQGEQVPPCAKTFSIDAEYTKMNAELKRGKKK